MNSFNLVRKVEEQLVGYGIQPGDRLLLALSGGVDSMALGFVLAELKIKWELMLYAAHLNHNIRPECQGLMEWHLIKKQCADIFEKIYYKSLEQGYLEEVAALKKQSLEEAARSVRYEFLHKCLEDCHGKYLVLAHHQDDQEETMVMRFFQGSSPLGLKGIPGRQGRIIRPLIGSRKKELHDYLMTASLESAFDESNQDNSILRNKVRNNLLPNIRRVFPGMSESLSRLQFYMAELAEYISEESDRQLSWQDVGGELISDLVKWNSLPYILKLQAIWNLNSKYNQNFNSEKIPFNFFNPLKKNYKSLESRIILKGYGFELKIKGNRIVYSPELVLNQKKGYFIKVVSDFEARFEGYLFRVYECDIKTIEGDIEFISYCYLDLKDHKHVILRNRRIGDKILLKKGSKSLKKLYNEWKIPEDIKWLIPVVEDSHGILAILGKAFGFQDIFSIHYKEQYAEKSDYILKIIKDGENIK